MAGRLTPYRTAPPMYKLGAWFVDGVDGGRCRFLGTYTFKATAKSLTLSGVVAAVSLLGLGAAYLLDRQAPATTPTSQPVPVITKDTLAGRNDEAAP